MKTRKKAITRLLALALILAFMFALPLSVHAEEEAPPPASSGGFDPLSVVGLLSYRYNSGGEYFYNTKYSPQWLFGFNAFYDTLSPAAGCTYDTLRFKFNFGGRDWMVQVWKGAYGWGLFTGGEIGIYSKAQWSPLEHYQSAATGSWIGMEFYIYNYQDKLFTRPMENTWWVTGFKQYVLRDLSREYVTMEAALRFPSKEMAAAFAQAVAGKGFALAQSLVLDRTYSTERYAVNGNTVRFLWKDKNEAS